MYVGAVEEMCVVSVFVCVGCDLASTLCKSVYLKEGFICSELGKGSTHVSGLCLFRAANLR